MIKKLFSLLGYVPKEDLEFAQGELDTMIEVQKSLTKIQANAVKYFKKKQKVAETALKDAEYKVKQLNAKNLRLLRKQGEFKEQIKELNQRNEDLFGEALELKDQAYYYKLISEAALEKLEYLCFGSILPTALRPSSLDRYQHLYKPVTPTYFKDRYGRSAIGVEYGQSED